MEEKAVFMNMCQVVDPEGRWLLQERADEDYPGSIFPGGHVEAGETFQDAVIREVFEETGLTIKNPTLVGIKHWTEDIHYVVLIYRATEYEGTLKSSDEGRVYWLDPKDIDPEAMVGDFADNLPLLKPNGGVRECCYIENETTGVWSTLYRG